MERKIRHISGVLLAGGKSRRMGQDKRNLMFGGRTLFQHVLEVLESVFSEMIIVVAELTQVKEKVTHQVVTDLIPNKGSAGGLYTGLNYASNPQVFAVACDMPFLNPVVIQKICNEASSIDVIMVKIGNRFHPMHSVYSQNCLPVLRRMIDSDQLRIQDLLFQEKLKTKILDAESIQDVDPQFKSFLNVNTPADLESAQKLISQ